jgi:cold shock CspA family protein
MARHESHMAEQGTVRFFNSERNSGYAKSDAGGTDVYLNAKQCAGDMLTTGDRIEYEPVLDTARRWYWARNIKVLA